jgi:hypothetical protein
MDELAARAVVVPASAVGGGLTTSIPRSEIAEVLDLNESPIELVLDVTQFSDGKATDTRSVSVSWERSELEELLRATGDGDVLLTFDREALQEALASQVEAHGLRETVLALAVAATAATGAAGTASAQPAASLSTGNPPIAETGTAPTAEIPYLSHGQGVTEADLGIPTADSDAASTPAEIPYLSHGQGVTEADLGIPTGTSPDDRALPRTDPVATPAATGGTASDSGTVSAPSPAETAAIAGVIALMITGAFFVVGGRRRMRTGAA